MYQNTALLKNFPLPREGTKLQFRAEFYNIYNHSNLYVNAGLFNASTDVSTNSFAKSNGDRVSGVTASFRDNRQIVLALKLIF